MGRRLNLQERAYVLRLRVANARRDRIRRASGPWVAQGRENVGRTFQGAKDALETALDATGEIRQERPRAVARPIARASIRIAHEGRDLCANPEGRCPEGRRQRTDKDGTVFHVESVNVPRRRGDGLMEYRKHLKSAPYRLKDGTVVEAIRIRSDAWARARSPQEGLRCRALYAMDRADVIGDKPYGHVSLGEAPRSWDEANGYGRWHPRYVGPTALWDGYCEAWAYAEVETPKGRIGYLFHRETGETKGARLV